MDSFDNDEFLYEEESLLWLWERGSATDPDGALVAFLDRCRQRDRARAKRRALAQNWPDGLRPTFGSGPRHGIHCMTNDACPACGAPDTWYSTYADSGDIVGFDSRFCSLCDTWLERPTNWRAAGEPRPARPSEVPFDDLVLDLVADISHW